MPEELKATTALGEMFAKGLQTLVKDAASKAVRVGLAYGFKLMVDA